MIGEGILFVPIGKVYGCPHCGQMIPSTWKLDECDKCKRKICPFCKSCHCKGAGYLRRIAAWGKGEYDI
jgi:hypothetical protein